MGDGPQEGGIEWRTSRWCHMRGGACLVASIYAASACMGAVLGLEGFGREITCIVQCADYIACLEEDAEDPEAGP